MSDKLYRRVVAGMPDFIGDTRVTTQHYEYIRDENAERLVRLARAWLASQRSYESLRATRTYYVRMRALAVVGKNDAAAQLEGDVADALRAIEEAE